MNKNTFTMSYQVNATATAGEYIYNLNIPTSAAIRSVTFGAATFSQGDSVELFALNANGVCKSLATRVLLKKADIYETINFVKPIATSALGGLQVVFYNAAALAKYVTINVEFELPDNVLMVDLGQTISGWDDEKGATRAFGGALTSTNTVDPTVKKIGQSSLKFVCGNADQTADNFNGYFKTRSGQTLDLSGYTNLNLWFYASDKDQAEYGVILEDASGNYSYWTFTVTANNTWEKKTITLRSPTGSSATAPNLNAITITEVYFKSKGAPGDQTQYIGAVWCE